MDRRNDQRQYPSAPMAAEGKNHANEKFWKHEAQFGGVNNSLSVIYILHVNNYSLALNHQYRSLSSTLCNDGVKICFQSHEVTHLPVVFLQSSSTSPLAGVSRLYWGSGIFSPNASISCSIDIMPLARSLFQSPMLWNTSLLLFSFWPSSFYKQRNQVWDK